MRTPLLTASIVACLATTHFASRGNAEDWPQWLGPHRNGVWSETGVVSQFPEAGATIKWRAPIAGGYSGPSVANGRVFVSDFVRTQGDATSDPNVRNVLEGEERLVCLDEATGQKLWTHKYPRSYEISYPSGPRATPTVDGDRVYLLGAEGNLKCLAVGNGDVQWEIDLKKQYEAPTPMWGFCAHPLVDGDRLYVTAGGPGSLALCLDKNTGKEIWRALTAKDAGYSPPTMIEADGRRELIIWTPESLNSLNPEDGAVHWSVPLEPSYGMSIIAPVQAGKHLFAGGIVNVGAMLELSPDGPPKELWKSTSKVGLAPVHSPTLVVGEHLYGIDGEGELTCAEIATGKRLWQTYAVTTQSRRAGAATAFLTRNDDVFYIFSENGDLITANLTPEGYKELSRAHVIEPSLSTSGRVVVWSAPAYANRCAYVRNDHEVVCVDLAAH